MTTIWDTARNAAALLRADGERRLVNGPEVRWRNRTFSEALT